MRTYECWKCMVLLAQATSQTSTGSQTTQQSCWRMALGPLFNLEAQQRYSSYRAILVAMVSQNSFELIFMGIARLTRNTLQNDVSHRRACVKPGTKGGIASFWGVLTSLEKYRAVWGTQRAPRLKKFKISLRDWKYQERLKASSRLKREWTF